MSAFGPWSGAPALVAVDWGTSSFRAALLGRDGSLLGRCESAGGIRQVSTAHAAYLERQLEPLGPAAAGLPIVACGMVGSRIGWVETPYLPCPVDISGLADAALEVEHPSRRVLIVPGLQCETRSRTPDVMRGEEAQILGTSLTSATVVLPGTHSKWARLDDGVVVDFSTYMTGELFQLLSEHGIVSHSVQLDSTSFDEEAFVRGVQLALSDPSGLSSHVFSVRTLQLLGRQGLAAGRDYLSGVLIGHELASGLRGGSGDELTIIGNSALASRYLVAARVAGSNARAMSGDCAFAGCWMIARARTLL